MLPFFGSCVIHNLYTGVLKLKKKIRRQRVNGGIIWTCRQRVMSREDKELFAVQQSFKFSRKLHYGIVQFYGILRFQGCDAV